MTANASPGDLTSEVLRLLSDAHRKMSTVDDDQGLAAATTAAVECAVHLVRACAGRSDPVTEAVDGLRAARAAVTAATFAVVTTADQVRAKRG